MTVDQFVEFLNKEQRDPRLNEILYPYANRARGFDLIEQYEPNKELAKGKPTEKSVITMFSSRFVIICCIYDYQAYYHLMDFCSI